MRLFTVLALLIATLGLTSCERDPIDIPCPAVGVGDIVVSEIRGDQSDSEDTLGEWIELYNTGSSTVDLLGARVLVTKLDGTSQAIILIRQSVIIEAGG